MPDPLDPRPLACAATLVLVSFATPAAAADPPAPPPAAPITLEPAFRLGPSFRVGEPASLTLANRAGLALSAGAWVTFAPRVTVGLSYEHVGLGREVGGTPPEYINVTRSLSSLWADLRLHLIRTPTIRLSAMIGLAMNWQNAAASAALTQDVGQPLLTIRCNASDSANFSFRAGLAAQFLIGNGVSFLLDAVADEVRLSTDPLDNCVVGGGTMTLLSARAGVAYEFDITRIAR